MSGAELLRTEQTHLVAEICFSLFVSHFSSRASDFEIAVFAANRIDRKNEIDVVPAISAHNGLGVILSRTC